MPLPARRFLSQVRTIALAVGRGQCGSQTGAMDTNNGYLLRYLRLFFEGCTDLA